MTGINDEMDALAVAAHGAITDFSDVNVRGYLKEHPDLVEHRLDLLTDMVDHVRATISQERAAGQWAQLPECPRADHIDQAAEYAEHTCCCPYCFHGGDNPLDHD
ncbi:hypothetical protein F4561_002231 [Lipingzhangella halophila]|uniref:Uncharacterized protein n=1 Tax=Lipingzhangella halophila TaxID=1783352 RepID=A0A7W7W260_9ACTN|nr:hypothetical protein [Lipingzhangella halophila]MBB4931411.1 hypothetical protein [Lipingzhangella halophila]